MLVPSTMSAVMVVAAPASKLWAVDRNASTLLALVDHSAQPVRIVVSVRAVLLLSTLAVPTTLVQPQVTLARVVPHIAQAQRADCSFEDWVSEHGLASSTQEMPRSLLRMVRSITVTK